MQAMNWMNRSEGLKYRILIVAVLVLLSSCGGKSDMKTQDTKDLPEEQPVLYVTNWMENSDGMERINRVFMEQHPGIRVEYTEYPKTEYDKQMVFTLKAGIAADIIYLRSYDTGLNLYNTGYLKVLNDLIPSLKDFPEVTLAAWSSENGDIYGVPSLGVIHGFYYNKKIFADYGLRPPQDWASLLEICEVLKDNGETVFAFGTKDSWVLYEVFFSGVGANFYGGESSRKKILNRQLYMKDPLFIGAMEKLKGLVPYFPPGYESIGYDDMLNMFAGGEGAMYIGGSWDIGELGSRSADLSSVGFFAPPPDKSTDTIQLCFHVDVGVAMNRVTRYPEAAEEYIRWVATEEYAQLIMDELPGFFSYTPGDYDLKNSLAREMESYIPKSEPTVRTLWEGFSSDIPTGNTLLGEAMKALLNGRMTSADAANYVHDGIGWYYK